jgi:hypothetical protein
MIWFYFVAAALLIWWVCGTLNVALIQAVSDPHADFNEDNRGTTLAICFVTGPFLTLAALCWFSIKQPIRYGTIWGRTLGRKINPDND